MPLPPQSNSFSVATVAQKRASYTVSNRVGGAYQTRGPFPAQRVPYVGSIQVGPSFQVVEVEEKVYIFDLSCGAAARSVLKNLGDGTVWSVVYVQTWSDVVICFVKKGQPSQ